MHSPSASKTPIQGIKSRGNPKEKEDDYHKKTVQALQLLTNGL